MFLHLLSPHLVRCSSVRELEGRGCGGAGLQERGPLEAARRGTGGHAAHGQEQALRTVACARLASGACVPCIRHGMRVGMWVVRASCVQVWDCGSSASLYYCFIVGIQGDLACIGGPAPPLLCSATKQTAPHSGWAAWCTLASGASAVGKSARLAAAKGSMGLLQLRSMHATTLTSLQAGRQAKVM